MARRRPPEGAPRTGLPGKRKKKVTRKPPSKSSRPKLPFGISAPRISPKAGLGSGAGSGGWLPTGNPFAGLGDSGGSSDTGGSWDPWKDPQLLAYKAMLDAYSVSDRASRNAAIQRAIINFGKAPENFNYSGLSAADINEIVTQTIRDLASQNTAAKTSVTARIDESNVDQQRRISNAMAARGIVRSGETGFQLGRQQTNYTRAQYDAYNQLLDYINGAQSAFTQAERERQMALMGYASNMEPGEGGGGGGGGGDGGSDPYAAGIPSGVLKPRVAGLVKPSFTKRKRTSGSLFNKAL